MYSTPLPATVSARYGFTNKVRITYQDLTAAATSQTIQVFPLSGNFALPMIIRPVLARVVVPFTGGFSALTASVGDASGVGAYLAAGDLTASAPMNKITLGPIAGYTSADFLKVVLTSTSANINTATAGVLEIYFGLVRLSDLDND